MAPGVFRPVAGGRHPRGRVDSTGILQQSKRSDRHRGRARVRFQDYYRGIPARRGSVRLAGSSDYDIAVSLYTYTVVPDTQQEIVTSDVAKQPLIAWFESQKLPTEQLVAYQPASYLLGRLRSIGRRGQGPQPGLAKLVVPPQLLDGGWLHGKAVVRRLAQPRRISSMASCSAGAG